MESTAVGLLDGDWIFLSFPQHSWSLHFWVRTQELTVSHGSPAALGKTATSTEASETCRGTGTHFDGGVILLYTSVES